VHGSILASSQQEFLFIQDVISSGLTLNVDRDCFP
jgi:hypothetical protein